MATLNAGAKCKVCRKPATLTVGLHRVCSYDCGVILARKLDGKRRDRERKDERIRHREAKRKCKRKGDLVREAQRAFNAWIRFRDSGKPCVSCGRPDDGLHQRHAGHYMTTGAHPELRFDESNCHAQCSQCNNHLSGNLLGYRPELIMRRGAAEVDRLESSNGPARYTREQLEEIRREYSRRLRDRSSGSR